MDERRDTGWEEPILQPAEELHMERDPREVVERYARPLPGRRSVPRGRRRRRRRMRSRTIQ